MVNVDRNINKASCSPQWLGRMNTISAPPQITQLGLWKSPGWCHSHTDKLEILHI